MNSAGDNISRRNSLKNSPRGLHTSLEGGLDDVDLLAIGQGSPITDIIQRVLGNLHVLFKAVEKKTFMHYSSCRNTDPVCPPAQQQHDSFVKETPSRGERNGICLCQAGLCSSYTA